MSGICLANVMKRHRRKPRRFTSTPEVTQEDITVDDNMSRTSQDQSQDHSYFTVDNISTNQSMALQLQQQQIIEQQSLMLRQQQDRLNEMMQEMAELKSKLPQPLQSNVPPTIEARAPSQPYPPPTLVVNMPTLSTLLPTFNGTSDNPVDFMEKLEEMLNNYLIPRDNWYHLLRPQFVQSAKEWFNLLPTPADYEAFKKSFFSKFDSLQVRLKLQAEYFGLVQEWSEPTDQFIHKKISIGKRIFPLQDLSITLTQIKELLHPKVKVHFLTIPLTLQEMLERGRTIDESLSHQQHTLAKPPQQYQKFNRENESLSHQQYTHTKPSQQYQKFNKEKPPKCKHCKDKFHFFKDCPTLKNVKPSYNPGGHANLKTIESKHHPSSLQKINVLVNNKQNTALIDNAAYPNYLHISLVTEDDIVQTTGTKEAILGGQDQSIRITGLLNKLIIIGTTTFKCPFLISPDLNEKIVLGVPFLKTNKCIIDFDRNCIILGTSGRQTVYFIGHAPQEITEGSLDFDCIKHDFPEDKQDKYFKIMLKYKHLFDNQGSLRRTDAMEHVIRLQTNKPVQVKAYKLSDVKRQIAETQISEMLDNDVIEDSESPYSSPIVIVNKDNKDPRFCIDFKKLNEVTVDEECQSLEIKDLITRIGENKVFSTLDLLKGYWQVPLSEESKQYTAFTAPDGRRFQFKVVPFGLKGAPGTFMRMMRKVLGGLTNKICEVFLDDIIIYSPDYETHLHHLELVLERLHTYNLMASLKKCQFGKEEITYLGHIVSENTRAQAAHINAIQQAEPPRTRKKLQSLIGTLNWLRDYVPKAAEVMAPLTSILSRKPFVWTEEDTAKLDLVKKAFSDPQPLHRPKKDLPLILQTDASSIGISACLYQENEERKFIISNSSAKLNSTQRNYHINELEMMAIVWAIKKYQPYLEGVKFILRTDRKAVSWFKKFKEEKSKLVRWSLILQEFDFEIQHVAGTQNELPDSMSRYPLDESVGKDVESWERMLPPESPEYKTDPQCSLKLIQGEMKSAQEQDKFCNEIMEILGKEECTSPKELKTKQEFHIDREKMIICKTTKSGKKVFVPEAIREEIMRMHHDGDFYRHPGVTQTLRHVQVNYTWPNMSKDIRKYVKQCIPCARTKVVGRTNKPCLVQRKPIAPMHTLSIDLMGPYTRSKKGKRYLLVISDTFSRWTDAYPLPQADTKRILSVLQEFCCRYGWPKIVLTDNGSQFSSKMWKDKLIEWKIIHHTTAIYTPRQNPVERQNQNIKNKLRLFLQDKTHNRWDEELDGILFSIRNSTNASTGFSPAEILFGKNLSNPTDWPSTEVEEDPKSQAEKQKLKREETIIKVKKSVNIKTTDQPAKIIEEGESVLIRNNTLSNAVEGVTASLNPRWIGPYKIKKHLGANVYLCQNIENTKDTRKVDLSNIQIRPSEDNILLST